MWIGFAIIIFGIVTNTVDLSPYIIIKNPNVQVVTISSGIITEVISALFLFIYNSSKNQLTYFYNRQVFVHNALLAYNIAISMKDPDNAKKLIIDKILEFGMSNSFMAQEKSKEKSRLKKAPVAHPSPSFEP